MSDHKPNNSNISMTDIANITAELSGETFTDAMRRHVGHGKKWSVAGLAEGCQIDVRTMAGYHQGETSPCFFRFLRIAAALEPEFVNEIFELAGLSSVRRIDPHELTAFGLNHQLSGLMAVLGEAMADGRVDHREKQQLKEQV